MLRSDNVVHLLLTRFNVIGGRVHSISNGWLEHRLKLFQSLCLPSVASQSDQGFVWLIFVDESTNMDIVGRLGAFQRDRFFEICFCPRFDRRYFGDIVRAYSSGYDYVITSRLDNDDILHPSYIQRVRSGAIGDSKTGKFCERYWVNLNNGYRLSSCGLYRMRAMSNSFISLVEPVNGQYKLATVYAVNHTRAITIAPIRSVECTGSWIQVIHGYNLRNRIGIHEFPMRRSESQARLSDFSPQVVSHCSRVLDGQWDLT